MNSQMVSDSLSFVRFKCLYFQNCIEVLESMCRGDFGKCETEAQSYQGQCHKLFPFVPSFIIPSSQSEQIVTNGSAS